MKRLKQTLIKLFITFLFCSNSFSDTEQISSKNVLVIDGDTIILDKKKIDFQELMLQKVFLEARNKPVSLKVKKFFVVKFQKKN